MTNDMSNLLDLADDIVGDDSPEDMTALIRDAKRWRALMSSARVKIQGTAGFGDMPEGYTATPGYRHFGMEIWSLYNLGGFSNELINRSITETKHGLEIIEQYADAIVEHQLTGK